MADEGLRTRGREIGRYALYDEIASGGMATVHFGRVGGPAGFVRRVAIKRLHAHFARDPEFVAMFLDEARLTARIHHPNVVATLDVVAQKGELFLVMDYVQGESLARLLKAAWGGPSPPAPRVTLSILAGTLYGLHGAHEAKGEGDEPLGIVHRDVSPQNILVGSDGVARVIDFGVAKAAFRLQSTRDGQLKGKLRYMSPEQLRKGLVDRRADVYAAAVVLWEALAGRALFAGDDPGAVVTEVLDGKVSPPSRFAELPKGLDEVVLRGLAARAEDRYPTALAFATALEAVGPLASPREVGQWVEETAGPDLRARANRLVDIESGSIKETLDIVAASDGEAVDIPRRPGFQPAAPSALSTRIEVEPSGKAASSPVGRAAPRWLVRAGVVVGIALATSVGAAVTMGRARSRVDPQASAQAATPDAPPTARREAPPAEPARIASVPEAPQVSSRAPVPRAAPRRPAGLRNAPTGAPNKCVPPIYTVDPDGTKRYKPECI